MNNSNDNRSALPSSLVSKCYYEVCFNLFFCKLKSRLTVTLLIRKCLINKGLNHR